MELKYQLSMKDYETYYLQAVGDLSWDPSRLKILRVTKIVGPLLVFFLGLQGIIGEYFYLKRDNKLDIRSILFISITAVAFFVLLLLVEKGTPWLKRWIVKRRLRKILSKKDPERFLQEKPKEVVVNISDQHLQENLGEKVIEYTQPFIKNLIETSEYFAYIGADRSGLVVPKRVFQTEEEQAKFKEMLSKFIVEES